MFAAAKRANIGPATAQTLRRSLATATAHARVPVVIAAAMTGHSPQVYDAHYAKPFRDAEHDSFRQRLNEYLRPLQPLGWSEPEVENGEGIIAVVGGPDPDSLLPLTDPVLVDSELRPLGRLTLTVNKRSTRINLDVAIWSHYKVVRPYLDARRDVLVEIAAPGKCEFRSPSVPVLWEVKGGWGDDVDWPSRIAEVGAKDRPLA